MIAFVSGTISAKEDASLIIDVNGLGYRVFCSPAVLEKVEIGAEQKMYTYFVVRETDQSLYGFLTQGEKEVFQKLLGVSGVGPKSAIKIVSKVSAHDLANAIMQQDESLLQALGVGKKMAERLIVDLKGKDFPVLDGADGALHSDLSEEVEALVALGYSASDASGVLKKIDSQDSAERIKEALKILGKS